MSDTVLKFIPTDPTFIPPAEAQQQAVEFLESLLPEGWECQTQVFPRLEFIDQGENLTSIMCPLCHTALRYHESETLYDWWHSISDEGQEKGYEGLRVSMPCCHREVLFTDLTFDWPGGFARFQLDISNPQIGHPLPDEDLKKLSIAITPESWKAAVLEVSIEIEPGGMGHTIVSPEGHRQPIMPSGGLMQSTYELLTLFRQYGREWKRMTFTLELRPEGEWHYVCHFVYD